MSMLESIVDGLMPPAPTHMTREQTEQAIIEWRAKREERLAADKVAAKLKEEELSIKGLIINTFRNDHWEGMVIHGRFTGLRVGEQPTASDRAALSDYILLSGRLDMLEFRLAKKALSDMKENGFEVPGVQWVDTYDLSDRKA